MRKFVLFFLIFIANTGFSQVIPIGTVIKGKRLPTLSTNNILNMDNSSATLNGSIKINDSKLSIIENGFVILLASDGRIPDINNARIVMVSGGTADFTTTIDDFISNTNYKYRAYAKNSRDEYAYSEVFNFTTFINWCVYHPSDPTGNNNPCKNSSRCVSTESGPICVCTANFCGDCCVQIADGACPGGGEQLCPIVTQNEIAASLQTEKLQYFNTIIKPKANNLVWSLNNNTILQGQEIQGLK